MECVKDGKHTKARATRNRDKAKEFISSAVTFAINNGLKDDEIREIINEAFVKHIMES